MKLKKGYVIREIAKEIIVVPTGEEAIHFNGIISLNKTGKVLFEALQQEQTEASLLALVLDKYDVEKDIALNDIQEFISLCKEKELLENE